MCTIHMHAFDCVCRKDDQLHLIIVSSVYDRYWFHYNIWLSECACGVFDAIFPNAQLGSYIWFVWLNHCYSSRIYHNKVRCICSRKYPIQIRTIEIFHIVFISLQYVMSLQISKLILLLCFNICIICRFVYCFAYIMDNFNFE